MCEKKKPPFMCGVKLGEHSRDVEALTKEIKERVIDAGCNFVYIRTKHGEKLPQEVFFRWAKILSENNMLIFDGKEKVGFIFIGKNCLSCQ